MALENKLIFKYGTMNSAKSANLLMMAHNYKEQGLRALLIKPSIDTRSKGVIKSRMGLAAPCKEIDMLTNISTLPIQDYDVILVDEAQFLLSAQVEELHMISNFRPVICFGLLTDFKTNVFVGSKRLIELADKIEKIEAICSCGKPAKFSLRVDKNGKVETEGDQIQIGGNDIYKPFCKECYFKYSYSFGLKMEKFKELLEPKW